MKEEWLMPGAVVPVDPDTTKALVDEIKRLIGVIGGMALQAAAQPAPTVQEPVAWTVAGKVTDWSKDFSAYQTRHYTRPVYTTPPAAQPAPVLEGRDWSLLEATQESLREHMAEIKRLKEAQPAVPASWMETVTANLVREGVNKHKARELAEHFYGLKENT